MARTSLMTSIFLSPVAARTTVNSVCSSTAAAAAAGAGSGGDRDGRSRRDAPLLLEQLGELGGLENGQRREVVDELGKISHVLILRFGSND